MSGSPPKTSRRLGPFAPAFDVLSMACGVSGLLAVGRRAVRAVGARVEALPVHGVPAGQRSKGGAAVELPAAARAAQRELRGGERFTGLPTCFGDHLQVAHEAFDQAVLRAHKAEEPIPILHAAMHAAALGEKNIITIASPLQK